MVFEQVNNDLRSVEEEKVDKQFFKTEEFQTIIFILTQQLQTTHDKAKLKALSDGLARGCLREFSSDSRKELFFRILRDMAPSEFQMLKNLSPTTEQPGGTVIQEPEGEDLAVLQRLEAHGLVRVSMRSNMRLSEPRYGLEWDIAEAKRALREAFETPPSRHFQISGFGFAFLGFFAEFQSEEMSS